MAVGPPARPPGVEYRLLAVAISSAPLLRFGYEAAPRVTSYMGTDMGMDVGVGRGINMCMDMGTGMDIDTCIVSV